MRGEERPPKEENDDALLFCDDNSKDGVGVVRITSVVTVVDGVVAEHKMLAARKASTDDIMTHVEMVGIGFTSRKPGGGGGVFKMLSVFGI